MTQRAELVLEAANKVIESRYSDRLQARTGRLHEVGMDRILALLTQTDALEGSPASLTAILGVIDGMRDTLAGDAARRAVASSMGTAARGMIASAALGQRVYLTGLGVDGIRIPVLQPDRYLVGQLSRIRDLDASTLDRLESVVREGFRRGQSVQSLTKALEQAGDISRGRARFLARNETGNLASAVAKRTQQNLGIREYLWMTSEDSRVRSSHSQRHRMRFSWDSPPSGGHPGEDFGCRCRARPIVPSRRSQR